MNEERQLGIRKPPMEASQEATTEQLRLARQEGDSYYQAMQAMKKETGTLEVMTVGDYEIAVTAEEAEGMWHLKEGLLGVGEESLEWRNPEDANSHIEVAVRDAADGRFIPGLDVDVTVYSADGNEVGTHRQEFLWHPWLYHYGHNWQLPGDGKYRIHVKIDPPKFMRHDHMNGRRYKEPAEADFAIPIKTGQKKA
ncbi:MAG: iron transporter [Chloroflexota bacterium]